jgi:hypothetical protein
MNADSCIPPMNYFSLRKEPNSAMQESLGFQACSEAKVKFFAQRSVV